MDDKYNQISVPTLIITGTGDRLLPSRDEGRRLKDILSPSNSNSTTVPLVELVEFNSGHAIMDDSFDLAKVMNASKIFQIDFALNAKSGHVGDDSR